jgi:uncharacterized hydrophobic protein (TIGR00271 family)
MPQADDPGDEWCVVLVDLPNDSVGRFVDAVSSDVGEATFVLVPIGSLAINTPIDRMDAAVRDVSTLSTMEVVASSLQSVGAWRGMLVYSLLAGIVGAWGVVFDVVYLLVAAMLINPMGAPAMVSVIGMAIGDSSMFARGGIRFLVSLLMQAAAALAFGLAYGLSVSTRVMEQVTSLSAWAALLALAAGAAGAHAQLKSERDSLVSGTAAGFMVAAALAPPAAVLGLALALARWDHVAVMAFLLLLQFVAIGAGGWITLHLLGVRPGDPSIGRGSVRGRTALAAGVLAAMLAIVVLHSTLGARFTKADLSRAALEIAHEAVAQSGGMFLIEANARFTRVQTPRHAGEALLFELVVEQEPGASIGIAEAEARIRQRVRRLVAARMSGVAPFVRVTVLPGLPAPDN